jgi:predicted transcriptional regulator
MRSVMQARSADTDPETERKHFELLRQAGSARRAQMALALSAQVIEMAHRAIRNATGLRDPVEVKLRFVEIHYGPELAAGVRSCLAARKP